MCVCVSVNMRLWACVCMYFGILSPEVRVDEERKEGRREGRKRNKETNKKKHSSGLSTEYSSERTE